MRMALWSSLPPGGALGPSRGLNPCPLTEVEPERAGASRSKVCNRLPNRPLRGRPGPRLRRDQRVAEGGARPGAGSSLADDCAGPGRKHLCARRRRRVIGHCRCHGIAQRAEDWSPCSCRGSCRPSTDALRGLPARRRPGPRLRPDRAPGAGAHLPTGDAARVGRPLPRGRLRRTVRGRQRNDLHLVERAAADNPEQELCRAPGGPTTTSTLRSPPSATPWVEVGHSPSRTMSAAEALGTSLAALRPRWDSDKGTQVTAAYR